MNEVAIKALPEGWQLVPLGTLRGGTAKSINPSDRPDEIYDLYSIPSYSEGIPEVVTGKEIGSSKRIVEPNTVLLSKINPRINRVWIVGSASKHKQISSPEWIEFFPIDGIEPKYIMYFMQNHKFREHLSMNVTGVGGSLTRIRPKIAEDYEIPLAPIEQQKRIVAKIEKLFSHIDAGIASLQAAKKLLKQYRQSVLKAAVTGELTKDWRKANKDKLEPASQLLERILKERRQRWEEQQLEQFEAKGKLPKDDKWKEKYKEPDVDEVTKLIELPEGWSWIVTELLAKDEDNSLGAGPFGTIFKKKDFRESGVPIIFLRHVKAGRYLTKKPTFMDQTKWDELFVPYSVFGGEILMTKLGDPPGEAAIYPMGIGHAMVTPDVIKLDVNGSFAVPEFVMNFFNSEISTSFITKLAFGTTRLRVTLPIFKALPVPLPPLEEQREIVRIIAEKSNAGNKLEDEIDAQLINAEKNKQSVLAAAFSGLLEKVKESIV